MQPVKRNGRTSGGRTSGLSVLGDDLKAKFMEWDDRLKRLIEDVRYKLKHLPQTNYELGQNFARAGRVNDAVFRFRMATYFAPDFTDAWYNLGCCLIAKGDNDKAVTALKKTLQLDPVHSDAKFMLATIDPNLLVPQERPTHMPSHMVEGFFGRVAGEYDMAEGANGYVGPQHFHTRVMATLKGMKLGYMLDLGCGTGLAAMPFRKDAAYISGIDITPEMIARAQLARLGGVPLYDELLTTDVNSPGAPIPQGVADLVVALNVMPYLGECLSFITHAARALKPGGIFAVSVEPYASSNGYGVVPATSRFGHGVDYVRGIAQHAGLELVGQDSIQLYTNSKAIVLLFSRT